MVKNGTKSSPLDTKGEQRVQELNDNELDMVTGGTTLATAGGNREEKFCQYCGKFFWDKKDCEKHEATCRQNPANH